MTGKYGKNEGQGADGRSCALLPGSCATISCIILKPNHGCIEYGELEEAWVAACKEQ